MRRRIVPIYLDAGVERPWERSGPSSVEGWRHPNLLTWAQENRSRLVRAAVTLVAHYAAGWRDGEQRTREQPTRLMGSFESWSHVIGGAVTAAGAPGFGLNLERLFAEQSVADEEWGSFLARWPEGAKLTASAVAALVTVGVDGGLPVDPPEVLRNRMNHLNAQTVGNGLRAMRGKVRGGKRLENDRAARPTEWYVESVR